MPNILTPAFPPVIRFKMNLPDLKKYRTIFKDNGVTTPLSQSGHAKTGLYKMIPKPEQENKGWPWDEETSPDIYDTRIKWPKLTIVTPSFNQGQFIEQTIRAVLLQNYPNLEYIIIDGGSTDNTTKILEKYSPWISYWQSTKDDGQGNAINLGFSLSSGEYHAWINSDDYYLKGVFQKVIQQFLSSKAEFIYGYGYNYKVATGEFEQIKTLPYTDYFIKIPSLIQPSTFWNARIHEPIWEELYCALDYELWLRMVKGHKRALIKEPLSVAHVHDDAKTSDPKMKAKWEEDHQKIWGPDAHGTVHEWKRIVFLNRIRKKLYKLFDDLG
ncbi:glycosyltransferase family 2 protein [Mucilaginibacter aquariorum]|uniref:glycosyltransferase family 2 protein n=1 Tax=Mucilaginibacter aquariorum TaxID=2967225 RepID=UPI0021146A9D|nr:glycosyltransferase family 2 protein [Mucilaginibacter aquariorum]